MRYGYDGSGIAFLQGVEKGSLGEVDDCMALGLLSQRESRKDLWVRLITLLPLYTLLSTLF
jgi:hypothetical protein